MPDSGQSFWDHLDELRGAILRSLLVVAVCSVVAFIFGDRLFEFVLAPKYSDFLTYRLIDRVCALLGIEGVPDFNVRLISTGLARQFLIHVKTAICVGVIVASPYILFELYRFISPALYENERKNSVQMVMWGYVMFLIGVSLAYMLIFPLTFRFLGTYQVDSNVINMIDLDSYMSVLLTMSLCMGIVFEMPVLAWLFAKDGFLTSSFMCRYRKHAIVIILTLAAIITPTSDVFTLMLVSVPMWLLFELSIRLVCFVEKRRSVELGNV